jgi:hypothetical protein
MFAAGIFIALATSYFQAMIATDIVRSNAEAVREIRQLTDELREQKEASWRDRTRPM